MEFHVYVLWSESKVRTYVGQTSDVKRRLEQHNAGKVRSTKAHRPWRVIHRESFVTRMEAKERELWYKSPAGRRHLRELLNQNS